MSYCVLDLETNSETSYGRKFNALDDSNTIEIIALKPCDKDSYFLEGYQVSQVPFNQYKTFVGQNFKFDLLYLWKYPELQEFIKNGGIVWDTMLVQYLLDGQRPPEFNFLKKPIAPKPPLKTVVELVDGKPKRRKKTEAEITPDIEEYEKQLLFFESEKLKYKEMDERCYRRNLDALARQYGGTVKDNRIKDMYESGMKSKDIPRELLVPYALDDVKNTEIVYLKQLQKAKELKMLPLIKGYNEHLLAVCEIEFNGLYFNHDLFKEMYDVHKKDLLKSEQQLKAIAPELNPYSPSQVSLYLFGVKDKEVTESVLKEVDRAEAELIRQIRHKSKLVNTYLYGEKPGTKGRTIYTGLKPLCMPDGCIHQEFNVAKTATGRLSSSNPNSQNLHPETLKLFTSRYGDNGVLFELDYSQLEVVVQAWLTQDPQFIEDINNEVDFHVLRLSYIESYTYEELVELCANDPVFKAKRKKTKIVSFSKAYGAGDETIAKNSGLSVDIVRDIFAQENERYRYVKSYYDLVMEEVQANLTYSKLLAPIFPPKSSSNKMPVFKEEYPQVYGFYQAPTGQRWAFKEGYVLQRGGNIFRYFRMPEIMDYPVQGTAATIVALQVARVYRWIISSNLRDKIKIVNEVHDSLILDVEKSVEKFAFSKISTILNDVPTTFKKYFGIDFNVPIKVEGKAGKSWADCK